MLNSPYAQYRRTQAETAEPGELVVMLYRGAISFLQRAVLAIRVRDYQTANNALLRAEDIILELSTTLDPSAGSVAANLARLYEYSYSRLVQANCQKDAAQVEEILRILQELLPAWQEAARVVGLSRRPVDIRPIGQPVAVGSGTR